MLIVLCEVLSMILISGDLTTYSAPFTCAFVVRLVCICAHSYGIHRVSDVDK